MIGATAKDTLEARALALGWEVIEYREDDQTILLECMECWARIRRGVRGTRVSLSSGGLRACRHPAVDEATPYEDDRVCRRLRVNFAPMSLQEVGDAMKVSRERVRQIEEKALRHLVPACEQLGITRERAMEILAYLDSRRPEHLEDHAPGFTREDGIRHRRKTG